MNKIEFIKKFKGKYPSDFVIAVYFVLEKEGGLSNDPVDRGGLTKFGISQRAFRNVDIRNLTLEKAVSIYYRNYWRPNRTGELPSGLSISVFDASVQHGTRTAARFLQEVIGTKADGIVGRHTLATAKRDPVFFNSKLMLRRARYYARIIKRDPSQGRFINGWHNRLDDLLFTSFSFLGV